MANGEAGVGRSWILQLQRSYGNRYVQRMLALARKGEGEGEVSPEVEAAIERCRGGGQTLDVGVRRQMEPAFGADFSGVRVHTGAEAHSLNRAVNAIAFTTGQDIFFRDGAYDPASSSGRELLAHELTHVVQQGGRVAVQSKLVVGEPDDAYEQEADRVAKLVVANLDMPVVTETASPNVSPVHRLDACGEHSTSGGVCEEFRAKGEGIVQDLEVDQVSFGIVQRGPNDATPPAPQPAAPEHPYLVGGVSYTEKQYDIAVVEVADLWTAGNGIVAKQKTAVARFCSKSAAGADKEPDFIESAFQTAVMAIIGIATDGVGLAVGAAAEAGTGKLISLLPKAIDKHSVEAVTKKVLDAAIDKGKEKAREAARKTLEAAPSIPTEAGFRKLATPLATFQAALEDSIDLGCGEEKKQTLQTLLDYQNTSPPEAKWVAAAALYEGLKATLDQADEVQWNSTSDAWFNMQMASGRGTSAAADIGRVLIDLKDTYPNEEPRLDAAYLYGQGVNETTLEPYNHRALGDIGMSKLVVMDGGSMGWGWVDCKWKMLLGPDNSVWKVKETNRYGELWLAAHAVGKEDLDTDDDEFGWSNVEIGAQKVWDSIKGRTTTFKEASATAGPSPW